MSIMIPWNIKIWKKKHDVMMISMYSEMVSDQWGTRQKKLIDNQ